MEEEKEEISEFEKWQDAAMKAEALLWKEIDRLKAENEKLRKAAQEFLEAWVAPGVEMRPWEDKLREALGEEEKT